MGTCQSVEHIGNGFWPTDHPANHQVNLMAGPLLALLFILTSFDNFVSGFIRWECGSPRDKFRCGGVDAKWCLRHTSGLCSQYLDPVCDNKADQWTGLCDHLCPDLNGTKRFSCGDGTCIDDFLKWCDNVTDCKTGADEAYCDCEKNPEYCSLEWKERWSTSDYLKIILPICVLLLIVVIAVIVGLCKNK